MTYNVLSKARSNIYNIEYWRWLQMLDDVTMGKKTFLLEGKNIGCTIFELGFLPSKIQNRLKNR